MSALELADAQRHEMLDALAACDGSPFQAAKRLKEMGVEVTKRQLEDLREQHPGYYQAICVSRKQVQEEAIAQEYRELTRGAQRVTKAMVEEFAEAIDEGGVEALPPDVRRQAPQLLTAMGKVMQTSTDKLLAMTGRPVDGGGGLGEEAIKELERLGVIKRHADAESTAVEA